MGASFFPDPKTGKGTATKFRRIPMRIPRSLFRTPFFPFEGNAIKRCKYKVWDVSERKEWSHPLDDMKEDLVSSRWERGNHEEDDGFLARKRIQSGREKHFPRNKVTRNSEKWETSKFRIFFSSSHPFFPLRNGTWKAEWSELIFEADRIGGIFVENLHSPVSHFGWENRLGRTESVNKISEL